MFSLYGDECHMNAINIFLKLLGSLPERALMVTKLQNCYIIIFGGLLETNVRSHASLSTTTDLVNTSGVPQAVFQLLLFDRHSDTGPHDLIRQCRPQCYCLHPLYPLRGHRLRRYVKCCVARLEVLVFIQLNNMSPTWVC